MREFAVAFVLLSAILHATWNAQLKSSHDRAQFMVNMCLAVGVLALLCTLFAPWPSSSSWMCVGISGILHIAYNLLLLQNYKRSDLGSAYAIARGISPCLVTLGAFFLMKQRPSPFAVAGVAMISVGVVFLSTSRERTDRYATLSALATGCVIAAYTVVDGMGVQRSASTLSYTAWVFASYLLTPVVMLVMKMPVRAVAFQSLTRPAAAGVFSLAAYTLVLWATHYADIGIISALRETSVLWAVLIGRQFLGETLSRRKIASALAVCSGVMLLVVK